MTDEQTAVAEAPPPRPALKVLHALVQMKQEEYERLSEQHGVAGVIEGKYTVSCN